MLKTINCPSCGGAITDYDEYCNDTICPFCESLVVNLNKKTKSIVKEFDFDEDFDNEDEWDEFDREFENSFSSTTTKNFSSTVSTHSSSTYTINGKEVDPNDPRVKDMTNMTMNIVKNSLQMAGLLNDDDDYIDADYTEKKPKKKGFFRRLIDGE